MTTLLKSESVLDLYVGDLERVHFEQDEPSTQHLQKITIPYLMWRNMGQPAKITVSITPGDALNEED